jgi:hypothetical protein
MSVDVFNLYDLKFPATRPGEIETVRVRSRTEENARSMAAAIAGREGGNAWKDPAVTPCVNHGPAAIQWAGIAEVCAFGHAGEVSR